MMVEVNKNKVIDELIDPNQQVRIELWKYDPKLFSNDEFADSISVILSLKNNNDERVEQVNEYVIIDNIASNPIMKE